MARENLPDPTTAAGEMPWLLTASEVAVLLGVSKRTVRRWVAEAAIPYLRLPHVKGPRFIRRRIERWIRDGCPKPRRK